MSVGQTDSTPGARGQPPGGFAWARGSLGYRALGQKAGSFLRPRPVGFTRYDPLMAPGGTGETRMSNGPSGDPDPPLAR